MKIGVSFNVSSEVTLGMEVKRSEHRGNRVFDFGGLRRLFGGYGKARQGLERNSGSVNVNANGTALRDFGGGDEKQTED